ncbi:hypothetical protein KO353_02595 [Elioraea tepida]|jgi:hypothetical protein|uniref:Uncharacterized protein n=1 Tax=Elioraea tepida TaxID=2843330 RepID=A0A975U2I6_9PROT|nr:hypothetical protein [Elioraea tepida]QXM25160.1 hypothetical protein KO353_02595 [Elioraea tepida]
MAAPRLLAKTDLAAFTPVLEGGRPAIEQHARLVALLAARGLPTGLFAEPVITRGPDGAPASVSWYGEADADPVPLSSLSPARRAEVERSLSLTLAALRPALDDRDAGGLLRRALLIAEPDSILAVDGGVVLAGWGLVAKGTGEQPEALAGRLREGLGRYHPALASAGPGFFTGAPLAAPPSPAAPPAPAAAPAVPRLETATTASAPPPSPPHAGARGGGGRPAWWWMLPAALAIALLFLLLGVWLGLRMCTAEFAGRELRAGVVDEAEARAMIARQREANARLEREIAAARAALQGEICRPAGPLAPLAPREEGGASEKGTAPKPLPMQGGAAGAEGAEKAPEEPAPAPAPR